MSLSGNQIRKLLTNYTPDEKELAFKIIAINYFKDTLDHKSYDICYDPDLPDLKIKPDLYIKDKFSDKYLVIYIKYNPTGFLDYIKYKDYPMKYRPLVVNPYDKNTRGYAYIHIMQSINDILRYVFTDKIDWNYRV
jgi:hypothetical protein